MSPREIGRNDGSGIGTNALNRRRTRRRNSVTGCHTHDTPPERAQSLPPRYHIRFTPVPARPVGDEWDVSYSRTLPPDEPGICRPGAPCLIEIRA
jgi:hypothetical protein